ALCASPLRALSPRRILRPFQSLEFRQELAALRFKSDELVELGAQIGAAILKRRLERAATLAKKGGIDQAGFDPISAPLRYDVDDDSHDPQGGLSRCRLGHTF